MLAGQTGCFHVCTDLTIYEKSHCLFITKQIGIKIAHTVSVTFRRAFSFTITNRSRPWVCRECSLCFAMLMFQLIFVCFEFEMWVEQPRNLLTTKGMCSSVDRFSKTSIVVWRVVVQVLRKLT